MIQNTHLQVVECVIAPPNKGPRIPDIATTAPIIPPTYFIFSIGVISGKITMVSEYRPAPPMPCSVLQAMSWLRVCEKPQPREKAKKIRKAIM